MRRPLCRALCGIGADKALAEAKQDRLVILMYHRIGQRSPGDPMVSATPENFFAQMRYLKENYNVISFSDLDFDRLPPQPAIVTFDDGYIDNYDTAYPILRSLGLPATIFLTVDFIEMRDIPWWIKLTSSAPARRRRLEMVKYMAPEERERLVSELDDRRFPRPEDLFFSREQAEEMAEHGITFGAHTVSHPIMSRIPADAALEEARASRDHVLGIRGGIPVFAYPNGMRQDMSPELDDAIRSLGFRHAVSCIYGTNRKAFNLKRVCIGQKDSLDVFKMKLAGLGERMIQAVTA